MWRYVVHLTGDRAGADDVVQETLLRAWRTPPIRAYSGGLSISDLAAELEIPEGTVQSRLRYGLRALRLALQEKGSRDEHRARPIRPGS